MTRQEFENRTNLSLTQEEFENINTMYMEAGDNIDKDVFCKDYKKHCDSILLKAFQSQASLFHEENASLKSANRAIAEHLINKAHEYNDSSLRNAAVGLIGERKVVLYTINKHLPLTEEDIIYISDNIK